MYFWGGRDFGLHFFLLVFVTGLLAISFFRIIAHEHQQEKRNAKMETRSAKLTI